MLECSDMARDSKGIAQFYLPPAHELENGRLWDRNQIVADSSGSNRMGIRWVSGVMNDADCQFMNAATNAIYCG